MAANVRKEYTNGELTIVWQPAKCIHSEICVRALPGVYDPERRPWIDITQATTEELRAQIPTCPSGALSYFMNNGAESAPQDATTMDQTKVEVVKNGPLLVHGSLAVKGADGEVEQKDNMTAFCRCGASTNKPYCDGSHKKIDFEE